MLLARSLWRALSSPAILQTLEKMNITFRSNFNGDWSSVCQFCGKPHADHLIEYKVAEYNHRMPCKPEREQIMKKHNRVVWSVCALVAAYKIGKYFFDKILFIAELVLIKDLKNCLPVRREKV